MGTHPIVCSANETYAGAEIHSRAAKLMYQVNEKKHTDSERVKMLLEIVDEANDADRCILHEANRLKEKWDEFKERKRLALNELEMLGIKLTGESNAPFSG